MKKLFLRTLFIGCSLFSASCNDDDDIAPLLPTADFTANQLAIEEGGSIDLEYQTTLLRDFHRAIGATTVSQWVADMISENENWATVIE